ncbi:MAG: hypothetical protein MZV63_66210 [Marinilabiliales bacterium]|nr:hypothetical protein [Marinilabiliales bacterium]
MFALEREGLGPVHLGDLAGRPEGVDQPLAGNAVGQAALRRGGTRRVDDVDVGALGGSGLGGVSRRLDDDFFDDVGVDRGQGPRVDGVAHDDPVLDQDVGRDRGPLQGGPQAGLVVIEHESGNEAQDGREIAGQGEPRDEVLVQDDRRPGGIPVEGRAGPAGRGFLFDLGGLHPEIEGDGHPGGEDETVDGDGLEPGHLGDGFVAAGDQSGDGVAARFRGDVVRDPERGRRGHVEVGPREGRALVVDDPAPEGALGARRGGGKAESEQDRDDGQRGGVFTGQSGLLGPCHPSYFPFFRPGLSKQLTPVPPVWFQAAPGRRPPFIPGFPPRGGPRRRRPPGRPGCPERPSRCGTPRRRGDWTAGGLPRQRARAGCSRRKPPRPR